MDQQQKHFLNIKLSVFVYSLICNIPVCFFLCLASSIIGATNLDSGVLTIDFNSFRWDYFGYNYAIAFILAMIIGCFIPLTTIGRWFTALFHVKNDTYAGNMKYRLLSTLIISCVYYIIITPTLTVFNYFLLGSQTIGQALLAMAINAPIMLLVGFVSSLISDLTAYKVAHAIDNTF